MIHGAVSILFPVLMRGQSGVFAVLVGVLAEVLAVVGDFFSGVLSLLLKVFAWRGFPGPREVVSSRPLRFLLQNIC